MNRINKQNIAGNCVQYCLNYVRNHIPKEILNLAFTDPREPFRTIEGGLLIEVYHKFLKPDLDLTSSLPLDIPLARCSIERIEATNSIIITVPKELTNYRSIVSVNNIVSTLNVGNYIRTSQYGMAPSLTQVSKLSDAVSNVDLTSTSRTDLIGENRILVEDPTNFLTTGYLRVEVEHGDDLTDINKKYYPKIGELFLLATKIKIRTLLVVPLNEGHIIGGHEISVIRDIIDSYDSAKEIYEEELKKWRGLKILNNKKDRTAFFRGMISARY